MCESSLWHFQCTHFPSVPPAVWPAICLFSTMHCGIPLLNPGVQIEYTFPAAITSTLSSQERPVTHPNYTSPPRTLLKEGGRAVERRWGRDLTLLRRMCVSVCECVCVCVCVCVWSYADRRYAASHMQRMALARRSHVQRHRAAPAADDLRAGWSNQYFSRYVIQKRHPRCI